VTELPLNVLPVCVSWIGPVVTNPPVATTSPPPARDCPLGAVTLLSVNVLPERWSAGLLGAMHSRSTKAPPPPPPVPPANKFVPAAELPEKVEPEIVALGKPAAQGLML